MEAKAKELISQKKLSVYILVASSEEEEASNLQRRLSGLGFIVINPFVIERMKKLNNEKASQAYKSADKAYQLLRSDIVIITENGLVCQECRIGAMLASINGLPVYNENLEEVRILLTIGVE